MIALATILLQASLGQTCTALQCPNYIGCLYELGPSAANGEDAKLWYDINPGTGNLFLSHTDIVVVPALGPEIKFERFYNSQGRATDLGLGDNWTHTFSWRVIYASASEVDILRDNGQYVDFEWSGSAWTPQAGEFGKLTGSASTGFTYTTKAGTAYAFDNTTSNYGRLLSITPADNYAITVSYSSGIEINQVSLPSGPILAFTWGSNGHISQVADSLSQWKYGTSASSPYLLESVTYPNNDGDGHYGETQYSYSAVSAGTTTFEPGTNTAQLTEVEVLQSEGTWVPTNYFSYTNPASGSSEVAAAASGFDGTNLLRYETFSYSLCENTTSTATVTFAAGGSKTITSTPVAFVSTDTLQRLTAITSTGGSGVPGEWQSESRAWNSNLTLASDTNGRGYVTNFPSYDSLGNPTEIQEGYIAADGGAARTTTLTWHSVLSRPLTQTRQSVDGISGHNHVVTWNYNDGGLTNYLQSITQSGYTNQGLDGGFNLAATSTVQINYLTDGTHRVSSVSGPLSGALVSYAYWPSTGSYANYLETKTVATSASTNLVTTYNNYDAEGHVTEVTDPNSVEIVFQYDQMGTLTKRAVQNSSSSVADNYAYDLAEDLSSHTTPDGTSTNYNYDGALRLWREYAKTNAVVQTTPWSTVFDFNTSSLPVTVRTFSDAGADLGAGCTSSGTEQLCREVAYDAWLRPSHDRMLDSSNNVCSGSSCEVLYTYDANGNLASRSEGGLNLYTYGHDPLDRVTSIALPILDAYSSPATSTLTYDINDNLITRYDPKSYMNGGSGGSRLTTYSNDDFGRVTKVANNDIGTWFSNYDSAGNLIGSKDGTGAQLTYGYDYLSRRTSLTSSVTNDSVTYLYDSVEDFCPSCGLGNLKGRLAGVQATDPDGGLIQTYFGYDYRGRQTADLEARGTLTAPTYGEVGYTWNPTGDNLQSVAYPDGLIVTYSYPTANGYAPTLLPNQLSTTFQDAGTALVSNVSYFVDGSVAGLTYGNGSTRTIARNKRGQWTSLKSGPTSSPWLNQAYSYDSTGIGELTGVSFNPGLSNAWQWSFGYDGLRRLTSYSTNVRPTTDNYTWTYDEVGNRKTEVYNSTTTTYTYDPSNNTNELMSLSGGNTRTMTYDANGNVAQDHWYGGAGTWNQYAYSTRHRPSALNYYDSSIFQFTSETYENDGLERRWQKASHTGTWTQFYYDQEGRLAEEYQNNGVTVNSCPAYDLVDHIYLAVGASEVSQVIRRFQSSGTTGCPMSSYSVVDKDIYYVHEDYRHTPFAIESKEVNAGDGGLAWEAETTPFGETLHQGLPGPDGKIGTSDDLSALISPLIGLREQYTDTEFSNLAGGSLISTPAITRSIQCRSPVDDPSGISSYQSYRGTRNWAGWGMFVSSGIGTGDFVGKNSGPRKSSGTDADSPIDGQGSFGGYVSGGSVSVPGSFSWRTGTQSHRVGEDGLTPFGSVSIYLNSMGDSENIFQSIANALAAVGQFFSDHSTLGGGATPGTSAYDGGNPPNPSSEAQPGSTINGANAAPGTPQLGGTATANLSGSKGGKYDPGGPDDSVTASAGLISVTGPIGSDPFNAGGTFVGANEFVFTAMREPGDQSNADPGPSSRPPVFRGIDNF